MMNQKIYITINLTLFFIIQACYAQDKEYIYWENLPKCDKEEVINSEGINSDAVEFYEGKFILRDDEKTINLLQNISLLAQHDEKVVAFYFNIFCRIIANSDGALSEMLGNYIQDITLSDPLYVFNYFLLEENVRKSFASHLGYELYFKKKGTSNIKFDLKDFKQKVFEEIQGKDHLKEVADIFFSEIEASMKMME